MSVSRPFLLSALLTLAAGWAARGAAPVIDTPIILDSQPPTAGENVKVPVGKAVVFPITATDADGHRLTYKVTSDKTNVKVRVRTGHPKMKFQVSHAGDGTAADPAFSGTLEFALFRDFTPITASFFTGFAQSGFLTGQIFHRIADLNEDEDSDGSVIIQGGDPTAAILPPTAGTGGPGFTFDNEFYPSLIFAGRGQLAMANSGTNSTTFRGSNGSQFFITAGHPRFLDFNHTIFGQLLRGWTTLDKISKVPVLGEPADPENQPPANFPKVVVQIDSATLEPDFSDAIIVISATTPGLATVTVEAVDETGVAAEPKTFVVNAYKDEFNSPPIVLPVAHQNAEVNKILQIPLKTVDLERDYIFLSNQIVSPYTGQSGGSNPALTLASAAGFMSIGISATQYDMNFRNASVDGPARTADDQIPATVTVSDKKINAEALNIVAPPGVAQTAINVATFVDTDARGLAASYSAKINWGDGLTPSVASIARNTASPLPTAFVIKGTHTYAKPGTYPLVIDIAANGGQRATVRGMAVVTSNPLKAFGRTFTTKGATLTKGLIATFKDTTPAALSAYTAQICWGDGTYSDGIIRLGPTGEFQVLGTHKFPDAEDYSVVVRIHKTNTDPATDAYAWSLGQARGFASAAHAPPYTMPHLIGQFAAVDGKAVLSTSGTNTYATLQFVVINAGNETCPASKIRFFLSEDNELNTAAEGDNPKDQNVVIGANNLVEISLAALAPNSGVRYVFDKTSGGDTRLRFQPREPGFGMTLLGHFYYSDSIADNMPIVRDVAYGPFTPFIVTPTSLSIQEASPTNKSKTFTVKLAREPRGDVTIPITLDSTSSTQISVDKTSLVFSTTNWDTAQTVTVTAVNDGIADSTKTASVTLGGATSIDGRYNKQKPTAVSVSVQDSPITVNPAALTVKENSTTIGSKTFGVKLTKQPKSAVTIPLTLDDDAMAQISIDKASLLFDVTNWSTEQIVTVTALADGTADGTANVKVTVGTATSTDTDFANFDPADVAVTVQDE